MTSFVSKKKVSVVLFRVHDLRIRDNPALYHASKAGSSVIPIFLWSSSFQEWEALGAKTRARACEVWINEAVKSLNKSLQTYGSRLVQRHAGSSQAKDIVEAILGACGREVHVFMNTRYEPKARCIDDSIQELLQAEGVRVTQYNATLLYDPKIINLNSNKWHGHWGTLMPFYRACKSSGEPRKPYPVPSKIPNPVQWPENHNICICENHRWTRKIRKSWNISEQAAISRLNQFIKKGLPNYEKDRSRTDQDFAVSKLSPYIRHGMISPQTLYWAVIRARFDKAKTKTFGRRLFWRDLAYFHFHVFPDMNSVSIRTHYEKQKWNNNKFMIEAWKRGNTGFPMVDAGMRELWETGWMNQSVRMVVASFLTEFIGADWRIGLQWFHDTLVDADIAINAMMWQNAGRCGIDQWNFLNRPDKGLSRDPKCTYTKKWVPEVAKLPGKFMFTPWLAPDELIKRAGIVIGHSYPKRILDDLEQSRLKTKTAVLDMRRSALNFNDDLGYDIVQISPNKSTRVFTKKEYRMSKDGTLLHPHLSSKHQSNRKRKKENATKKDKTILHYFVKS